MDNCPQTVNAQIKGFTHQVARLLDANLWGVYLHGSLAMGCFNPSRSDVDLLVITHEPMAVATKRELAQLLLLASCAPQPIEISFLARADLVPWRHPTPFDFHYSETWRAQTQQELRDGSWQQWNAAPRTDPDLAAHVTIANRRGLCLQGAPQAEVFPEVPAADYLDSILGDSRDALLGNLDAPVSTILNVCRVYAFVSEGRICSKQEGGLWALHVVPADIATVIALALEQYADGSNARAFDPSVVAQFVEYFRQRL